MNLHPFELKFSSQKLKEKETTKLDLYAPWNSYRILHMSHNK